MGPHLRTSAALGGDKRVRTADPLLAKQVLSQLSYTPACLTPSRRAPSKLNNVRVPSAPDPLARLPRVETKLLFLRSGSLSRIMQAQQNC